MDSLKGLAGKYLGSGDAGAEGETGTGSGGFKQKLEHLADGYLKKESGPIDPAEKTPASGTSATKAVPSDATPGGLEGKSATGQTGQAASGPSSYIEKAKDAARDYLNKHPVEEGGEPKTGVAGYLDKAKVAAKNYLDKPEGAAGSESGGLSALGSSLGSSALVEKLLGLFKKHEGRELEPSKDGDYSKLSELAHKYLGTSLSPETLKRYVSTFLAKIKGTPAAAAAPIATEDVPATTH